MKRLLSLFVLSVFLFNMGGYYMMYWGLQHQSDIELRAQLDVGNYSDHQTITLKLPVALPYSVESNEFQRLDGEFEYKGEFYQLVKQQFHQDTLYVVCIKDHREKHLVGEMIHYTKLANDLPLSPHSLKLLGGLFKDYTADGTLELARVNAGWQTIMNFHTPIFAPLYRDSFVASPPPQQA